MTVRAERVAALDCGTNSTRLLVVDAPRHTLDRQMRITRLGKGVDATGALAADAIDRTLAVLEDYRGRMDELGVSRARLVATSAVRDAANGDMFLGAAETLTRVHPELLSGEEEGRLSFAGATADLPADVPVAPVLVVDIGGGSTELVVGSAGDAGSARVESLDMGCVRVTERFFRHDPPTPAEVDEARRTVCEHLEKAMARLPSLEPAGPMVGLAGTVSTVAALELSLARYDRDRIHHARLSRTQVGRWFETLGSETAASRLVRPGLVAGREDVIAAGVLVMDCVMDVFDRTWCLVSEDDILDGLVMSLLRG